MGRASGIMALFMTLSLLFLIGCTADQNTDQPLTEETPPVSGPSLQPTPEPSPEPIPENAAGTFASPSWQVAGKSSFNYQAYAVNFMNDKFGIMVGYSGEMHYTNDGGQSWPEGENTSACQHCLDIVDESLAWSAST